MKSKHLRALAYAALLLGASSAHAEYVSDELAVPLRSGPSNAHRILNYLPSGTRLDVLAADDANGYTQIRTARGTEGWVQTAHVVSQPTAGHRLASAEREVERLSQRLSEREQSLSAMGSEKSTADRNNAQLRSRVSELEGELAEIKRISSGAIDAHTNNVRLNELNQRLRHEVVALVDERDALEANTQQYSLLIGAGLMLLGLLLGIIIKARPRRSAWS